MSPAPDVAVIGGGIVGCSTAAFLAQAGASVTLYEREALAAGASGRNSGVVQHPFDPVLVGLHRETVGLYRRLAAETEAFRLAADPAGLLYVAGDGARIADLVTDLRSTHPDLEPTFLPPAEARRVEPALADDVAACRLAIGYPVAPSAATLAYAETAREAGARIEIGSEARPWISDGRLRGVSVAGRRAAAGTVVVAAGPWSPALLDPGGDWRPIERSWGVVVDLRVPDPPHHVLEELDVESAIEPRGRDVVGVAFSLVPAGSSSSLGSTFLASRPDPARVVPRLRERGERFVPAIATAPAGPVRSCARPVSTDGRPLIGAVPWLPGAFIAAGHGPWGLSTGPATGRLAADLVLGRVAAPPLSLDPGRFGAPA